MNDIVKIMMQDKYGNTAVMAMLNDFCNGKITPKKGVMFGVKLRCIHDDYISPLKDALAKADADNAVLVEALDFAESALSLMHYRKHDDLIPSALSKVIAALARVKGEVCPKN